MGDDMLISERFARFIAETTYDMLPPDVIKLAKERILDTIGAAVAGCCHWDLKEQFLSACREFDAGDCAVLGSAEECFSLARAAMINATFAHAIELDDGHKNAGCHAGAVVVPVALTLGEKFNASGREIITAVALGYEIVYRIVAQMTPSQIEKGFHPSGNCDPFGAMAVAGKLMGLDAGQIACGLGFAGLSASGLMEATITGQQSKCVQVGNAAYNGVLAAYYAKNRMDGTVTIFEGKSGFFHAQAEDVNFEAVCEGLGREYHISDTYIKLYPTCRHSQAAIEAALDLLEENDFSYEDVESVRVGTHQVAYDLTGIIKEPKNSSEAKFSLAYGAALALHEKSVGVCHLTSRYWDDPVQKKLANLVTVTVDPEVQALYPKKRGARMEIHLKDGRILEKELYDLKGSPNKPVGWKELQTKFVGNTSGVIPEAGIQTLIQKLSDLENVKSVGEIMRILH